MSGRCGQDSVERTIVENIPAPPETVRDHYVDLDRIAEVHPLVVSVQTVSRRITEVLRVPVSGPITAHARQFPGVRLDSVVSFDVDPAGTRLTERIRISAPWPLVAVTVRQAVAAHIATLAGMRRHFEAIGDDSGRG